MVEIGSPDCERISSPTQSRKDVEEINGDKRRRDGHRDLSRSQYSSSGELYKHSDRQSSRNSHTYCTHDDYRKRDKHVDDYDRDYPKSSSRSGQNSCGYESDRSRRDYEHWSTEYPRGVKYSQDKSDNLGNRSRDKARDSSSDRAGSATLADNQSSSSKQAREASGKIPSDQAYVTDSDVDAAKIAAMKAPEL
ncbi:Hypothetical predicted protein, partial [Olea europaea subsp. europaea]